MNEPRCCSTSLRLLSTSACMLVSQTCLDKGSLLRFIMGMNSSQLYSDTWCVRPLGDLALLSSTFEALTDWSGPSTQSMHDSAAPNPYTEWTTAPAIGMCDLCNLIHRIVCLGRVAVPPPCAAAPSWHQSPWQLRVSILPAHSQTHSLTCVRAPGKPSAT